MNILTGREASDRTVKVRKRKWIMYMGCVIYGAQREVIKNTLRELGVQELNLKKVMEISEKAHVRIAVVFL